MSLSNACRAYAPCLVYEVRIFVEPPRPIVQIRRNTGDGGTFLFFEEEAVHDRIGACRRSGNDRRGAGGSHGQQITVSHPFRANFFCQRIPSRRSLVLAQSEIVACLPVRPFKIFVASFLGRQLGTGLNSVVVNCFHQLVGQLQMFFALPCNAFLRQEVMVSHHSEPDRTVAAVRDTCIFDGIEIQVDHIVKCTEDGS